MVKQEIGLVDVSMRDGNQSLWGATGLSTPQMLQIAGQIDRVGFRAIDFTASSHMAVAVRYFKENPWERIRRVRAVMPRTPLQFITTGLRFIAWQEMDDELMRLVYRQLQVCGIRRFAVMDPMHDLVAILTSSRMIKEEGGAEVMAALTFTLSDVHTDRYYATCATKLAASPHIDLFYIKDPSGLLSPERARTLIPAVHAAIGAKSLEVHSHCTIGFGALSAVAAAEAGASAIHVGVGVLGNGTSLPEAERAVANLRALGFSVPVDDKALRRVATYWRNLAVAESLPQGKPREFDATFLRHQIAGGVMTTMERQLAEVGLAHRLADVIEETERVRAELGQPIMVTPFPQMVCSQALFNIIGGRRYAQVSDQVIRYVMGRFGRPTRPVDPAVEAVILDRARAKEIEAEPLRLTLAEMRQRFGALPPEDLLLRAVMPGDQLDAMYAEPPFGSRYVPALSPILALIRELAARPDAKDLVVERPGFRLALHRGGALV